MKIRGRVFSASLSAIAAIALLAGCGSNGGSSEESVDRGDGFEYGASQEEVDDVIADLEPVTLTYQPAAASPSSTSAAKDLAFQEYIESRSNGKVTLEMAWGQAIASHSEVLDALNDGRLDLAYYAAIYFPEEAQTVDAFSTITQYSTAEPLTGEAISTAMMAEFGWNSTEHIEFIEENGVVPLSPLTASGDYWVACNEPVSEPSDWRGRQIRIGGSVQIDIVESLNASPVSVEFNELYEAVQRGTVDCTMVQPSVAGNTGVIEVAPYVAHASDQRMTGSATAINLAGSSFKELPLAYQQIIFDAEIAHLAGIISGNLDGGHQSVMDARSAGGEFYELDPESEETIVSIQEETVDDLIADGRLPEDIRDQMENSAEKWTQIVEELGYTDEGQWSDFDEWYEPGSVDFRPLTERVFTEAAESHRPA